MLFKALSVVLGGCIFSSVTLASERPILELPCHTDQEYAGVCLFKIENITEARQDNFRLPKADPIITEGGMSLVLETAEEAERRERGYGLEELKSTAVVSAYIVEKDATRYLAIGPAVQWSGYIVKNNMQEPALPGSVLKLEEELRFGGSVSKKTGPALYRIAVFPGSDTRYSLTASQEIPSIGAVELYVERISDPEHIDDFGKYEVEKAAGVRLSIPLGGRR